MTEKKPFRAPVFPEHLPESVRSRWEELVAQPYMTRRQLAASERRERGYQDEEDED